MESDFEITLHNLEMLVQTVERLRAGGTNIDYQRSHFETFCKEYYSNPGQPKLVGPVGSWPDQKSATA